MNRYTINFVHGYCFLCYLFCFSLTLTFLNQSIIYDGKELGCGNGSVSQRQKKPTNYSSSSNMRVCVCRHGKKLDPGDTDSGGNHDDSIITTVRDVVTNLHRSAIREKDEFNPNERRACHEVEVVYHQSPPKLKHMCVQHLLVFVFLFTVEIHNVSVCLCCAFSIALQTLGDDWDCWRRRRTEGGGGWLSDHVQTRDLICFVYYSNSLLSGGFSCLDLREKNQNPLCLHQTAVDGLRLYRLVKPLLPL